jgi:hypothetical protein
MDVDHDNSAAALESEHPTDRRRLTSIVGGITAAVLVLEVGIIDV